MKRIRPSGYAIYIMLALSAGFVAMFIHGFSAYDNTIAKRAELVRQLGLTDLALFTEARFARHPSQADLHSAFQDHPMALDHFPSGSLISPPTENFIRPQAATNAELLID